MDGLAIAPQNVAGPRPASGRASKGPDRTVRTVSDDRPGRKACCLTLSYGLTVGGPRPSADRQPTGQPALRRGQTVVPGGAVSGRDEPHELPRSARPEYLARGPPPSRSRTVRSPWAKMVTT